MTSTKYGHAIWQYGYHTAWTQRHGTSLKQLGHNNDKYYILYILIYNEKCKIDTFPSNINTQMIFECSKINLENVES